MKDRKVITWVKIVLIIITVAAALAPFVIDLLYQCDQPIYKTHHTPSDMLGYVSAVLSAVGAVVLGAITLIQNSIFKEENDKAQKRLEGINNRSNELNSINLIIKYESDRLNSFNDVILKLLTSYNSTTAVSIYASNVNGQLTQDGIMQLKSFQDELCSYISKASEYHQIYHEEDNLIIPFLQDYYNRVNYLAEHLLNTGIIGYKTIAQNAVDSGSRLRQLARNYSDRQTERIHQALYNNLSLSKVQELFTPIADKNTIEFQTQTTNQGGTPNGKNETTDN